MKGQLLRGFLTAVCGALAAYFHVLLMPLCVLTAVMALDYLTGMAAAWSAKALSSRTGVKGILKKVGSLALVGVGMTVDYLLTSALGQAGVQLDVSYCFGLMITLWLIVNELVSILENLGRIGIPLPGFLTRMIERLKDSTER